jgi:hypothetical protein
MDVPLATQDYPLLNLFWTMMMIFFWVLWFMLLFWVIADIFRSHDLSGWGKAGWLIFVVVLPYLGVFVYLIARGSSMSQRHAPRAQQGAEPATRSYPQPVPVGSQPSTTDELTKLAGLHDHGVLTDSEYAQQKAKLLT